MFDCAAVNDEIINLLWHHKESSDAKRKWWLLFPNPFWRCCGPKLMKHWWRKVPTLLEGSVLSLSAMSCHYNGISWRFCMGALIVQTNGGYLPQSLWSADLDTQIAHWDIVLTFVPLLKSSQSVSKRSTDRLNLTTWFLAGKLLTPADLCVIRWRWSFVQSERSISVSTIQCWIYFLEAAHTMLLYGLILFSATAGMNSNFKMKIVCNRT